MLLGGCLSKRGKCLFLSLRVSVCRLSLRTQKRQGGVTPPPHIKLLTPHCVYEWEGERSIFIQLILIEPFR